MAPAPKVLKVNTAIMMEGTINPLLKPHAQENKNPHQFHPPLSIPLELNIFANSFW